MAEIQREYRDRLFCYIFGSEAHKEWTLSLYNAVNRTNYTDPEQKRDEVKSWNCSGRKAGRRARRCWAD